MFFLGSTAPSEAATNVAGRPLSATDAVVGWDPIPHDNVEGYQVGQP